MANKGYRGKKRRPQQKENVPTSYDYNSIVTDEQAMKNHGLSFENSYNTDSDSGKSNFDEEYIKNKPEPFQITSTNTVTIHSLNKQPQMKKQYVHNAKTKKDFSTPTSGKSGSSSTSKIYTNSNLQNNIDHRGPLTKNLGTVTPFIQPNLNKFAISGTKFQNLQDISCQSSSTNHLITKNSSIRHLTTNIGDNNHSIAENVGKIAKRNPETAFQNVILPISKNIATGTSQTVSGTIRRNIPVVHNVPETTGRIERSTPPINRITRSAAHSSNFNQPLVLNASDLPTVITKAPKPTNTMNSSTSHVASNSPRWQSVSNQNSRLSAGRDSLQEPLVESSENTSGTVSSRNEIDNTSCCTGCIDFICCNH